MDPNKHPKSTRPSTRSRKPKPARKPAAKLPDLTNLIDAFNSAFALIKCAHIVLNHNHSAGCEEPTLRQGIAGLKAVCNQLGDADTQLYHFQKRTRATGTRPVGMAHAAEALSRQAKAASTRKARETPDI